MYTCEQCKFFPDCEKIFDMSTHVDDKCGGYRLLVSEVEKKCDEFILSEVNKKSEYKRKWINPDGTPTDLMLRTLGVMDAMNYDRITDKFLDTLPEEQLTALTLKIFESQMRREKSGGKKRRGRPKKGGKN